jgi:putative FmdB family regulatory protein
LKEVIILPYYDYSCDGCGYKFEKFLSISKCDEPTTEPCPVCSGTQLVTKDACAPGIGDSVRLGITKPPADFQKYVLGRIKASVPGNNIGKSKFNMTREF